MPDDKDESKPDDPMNDPEVCRDASHYSMRGFDLHTDPGVVCDYCPTCHLYIHPGCMSQHVERRHPPPAPAA